MQVISVISALIFGNNKQRQQNKDDLAKLICNLAEAVFISEHMVCVYNDSDQGK